MKKFISLIAAFAILLSISAVSFAETVTVDDVMKAMQESRPTEEQLEHLLNLKDDNGVEFKNLTDPNMIHRIYTIKKESPRGFFSEYSGNFYDEIYTDSIEWTVPVIENGNVVGEYDVMEYNNAGGKRLSISHYYSMEDNNLSIAMIYPFEKIAEIIQENNIGVPNDIKSIGDTSFGRLMCLYIRTDKGEYIMAVRDIVFSRYNENDEYERKIMLESLDVCTADELVEEAKKAIEDKKRHSEELSSPSNDSSLYIDDGGEVQVTFEPTATPVPTKEPEKTTEPTVEPTQTPSPEPTSTITPTQTPVPETEAPVLTVENNSGNVEIYTTEEKIEFTDAKPYIDENNRTQIPLRAVTEGLGCLVLYDGATKLVTVKAEDKTITLTIGDNKLYCDGVITKMDTVAKVINDRTFIPIRFLAECMGYEVVYK